MINVPKCTSWLGHKFEPRYSKGPVEGHYDTVAAPSHLERMAEKMRLVTYERDICVRCGFVVEKTAPQNEKP